MRAVNTISLNDPAQQRVLFIQASPGGGSLIALYELLKRLDRQKFIPLVLCFYQNRFSVMMETIPGCKVLYLNTNVERQAVKGDISRKRFRSLFLMQLNAIKKIIFADKMIVDTVRNIIRDENINIVHHNNDIFLHRDCIRACIKTGVKQVVHNRSLTGYGNSPLLYIIDFFLIRQVDRCIAISNAVLEHFRRMYLVPETYSLLIPDIIDPVKYSPTVPDEGLKRSLGIQAGEFVITCIGRITYWKGQHVLLEAVTMLSRNKPSIKVLLVGPEDEGIGSSEYGTLLRKMVTNSGLEDKVVFAGNRADIPEIINFSDVIVHCSVKPEPQGMVIIESLLCRKRVIASNNGGSGEILNKYGGIPCIAGNAEQLFRLLEHEINYKDAPVYDEIKYGMLKKDFNPDFLINSITDLYSSL